MKTLKTFLLIAVFSVSSIQFNTVHYDVSAPTPQEVINFMVETPEVKTFNKIINSEGTVYITMKKRKGLRLQQEQSPRRLTLIYSMCKNVQHVLEINAHDIIINS